MSITIRNIEYIKLNKLGEGGSGRIIKVKSNSDNKYYALKEIIIRDEIKDKIENIQKEVDILSKINCENIIKYYGSRKINNILYIVMEYYAGTNLKEFIDKNIKNNKLIEENKLYNIIKQICIGIKEIHNNNIIHKDIKPENIFMNEKMEIKIGDFGISKQFDKIKEYKTTLNKTRAIYYIAPEVLIKGKYNEKSDMYSLGCVIYELFHLRKYYNDREHNEIKTIDYKKYNYIWQEIINSLLQLNYNDRMNINQVNNIILNEMNKKENDNIPYQMNPYKFLIKFKKENISESKIEKNNMNINKKQVGISSISSISADLKDLLINPILNIGCTIEFPEYNPYKCRATLSGPKDTPYKDGLFYIELLFPSNYPNSSPSIRFLTPIYNLNVFPNKDDPIFPLGLVYFSDNRLWNPSSSIRKMLIDLYSVFYWQDSKRANRKEMAKEYKENRVLYEKKAKYFTKKYASNENALKYCDQNWDFSCNEKDFELQESSEQIHQEKIENNKKYDGNKKIELCFSFNYLRNDSIVIQCELKELTGNVLKKFMSLSGLVTRFIDEPLFIYKCRNLNPKISIGDNGLLNSSTINVIYDILFN